MSDVDYLGRFSEPAYSYVQFKILFSDFKTKATYNPDQKEHITDSSSSYESHYR